MKALKKFGFDMAYLALLTRKDVKPLSRWESTFSRGQVKALHHLGLKTNTVERKLTNGSATTELIFSKSSRYLDFYTRRFDHTALRKDQQSVMTEGFLFGYPNCCVKNFAENGYTDNAFVGRGQEILFHWACPGCRATPDLLPYYMKVRQQCQQIFESQAHQGHKLLKASLPAAAFSLIIALAAGKARADDPHWYCSTAVDTIGNFLTTEEDFLLGTSWGCPSGDIPGGPVEALKFNDIIASLPVDTSDSFIEDGCFLQDGRMMGDEICQVCGASVNMGYFILHNPMRDLHIHIPCMALHYMEHGSFSYDGTLTGGRVYIPAFKQALAHYDTTHYSIETSNDGDQDGLRDDYEDHFGTLINNPDSNQNQVVDGAEVAEGFVETISKLPLIEYGQTPPTDSPYMTFAPANGIETCHICGFAIAMGLVTITNPMNDTQISFPNIALHYLAHGRFAYRPPSWPGEIDATQLDTVLNTLSGAPPSGHLPKEDRLSLCNYPNPFNANTQIQFTLPQNGHTTLRLYNVKGQLIRTLRQEIMAAGHHLVRWDGLDGDGQKAASGVYFCRLEHNNLTQVTKMLLLK